MNRLMGRRGIGLRDGDGGWSEQVRGWASREPVEVKLKALKSELLLMALGAIGACGIIRTLTPSS